MKRNHYLLIMGFACALLFLNAVLFSGSPPVSRTNAPGEGNCTACHSGNLNSGPGSIVLTGPANYTPGMTHNITVTLTDGTKSRFGFETTVLNGSNQAIGTMAAPSSNTSLQNGTVSGATRQYVGHSNASSNNTWTFTWTAPMTASGPATFYFAGNATNFNGSTSGDNVYANSFTMQPQIATTAAFSPSSTTVCLGSSVTFSDASVGSINSYSWDFGVGATPATATTPGPHSVLYSSLGTKSIQLIVNGSDRNDTLIQTVTVVDLPVVTIAASGPTALCPGDNVILDAGNFSSYLWNTGATTQTITSTMAGLSIVTVTDQNGCTDSDSITTTAQPAPNVAITGNGPFSFCLGDSVTLDAGNGFGSYLWSNGDTTQTIVVAATGIIGVTVTDSAFGCRGIDVQTITASNPMAMLDPLDTTCVASGNSVVLVGSPVSGTYLGTGVTNGQFDPAVPGVGTYQIQYAYMDSIGCTDTATQSIVVVAAPAAAMIMGYPDTMIHRLCPTDPAITLTGMPAGGTFFTSAGTGLTGNILDPSQMRPPVTQVGYATDDGFGCTDTIQVRFVLAMGVDSIIARSSPTFCEGDSVVLVASGPGVNFMWSTGDTSRAITVTQSGMYSVSAESIGLPGCIFTTDAIAVTVNPLPAPVITGMGTLSAGTFTTYQWFFADSAGNPITAIAGATTSTLISGDFAADPDNTGFVVVVVTDGNRCEGTSAVVPIGVSGIFDNLPSLSFSLYPNPVSDILSIELEVVNPSPVAITLLDAKGKQVHHTVGETVSGETKLTVPVSGLATGLYLIQVQTRDGIAFGKVMVK